MCPGRGPGRDRHGEEENCQNPHRKPNGELRDISI